MRAFLLLVIALSLASPSSMAGLRAAQASGRRPKPF